MLEKNKIKGNIFKKWVDKLHQISEVLKNTKSSFKGRFASTQCLMKFQKQ